MRTSLFVTLLFATLFAFISAKKHHHKHHHKHQIKRIHHHKHHHKHHKTGGGKGTGIVAATSQTFKGAATFFFQGGNAGSCGQYHPDSLPLVALNLGQVDGGAHCGRHVHIANLNNGKSVNALVADTCPGCNGNSLDLSTGAFDQIGARDTGVLNIEWFFTD